MCYIYVVGDAATDTLLCFPNFKLQFTITFDIYMFIININSIKKIKDSII